MYNCPKCGGGRHYDEADSARCDAIAAAELLEEREGELDRVREQRDHALEILKAALKQSRCDGDLCAYGWHEDAKAAIRENDPDWVLE